MSKELVTIGFLVEELQVSVGEIRQALESLAITPSMRINGVAHYPAAALERIRHHRVKGKAKMPTRSKTKLPPGAAGYHARVEQLVAEGRSRSAAVATASRENPHGRENFLLFTNRPIVRNSIPVTPIEDEDKEDPDATKAAAFDTKVAETMSLGYGRKEAVKIVAKTNRAMHRAYLRFTSRQPVR